MESLLERGEKLDDLVSKSEVLGAQSKAFYKTVGVEGHLLPEGAGNEWSVILGGVIPGAQLWLPGRGHPFCHRLWVWRESGCPNSSCRAPQPLAGGILHPAPGGR